MAIDDIDVIHEKNAALYDEFKEKMREWNARKVGAKPKLGKYYSQTLACFCCQQQCNMSSTGYNCWMF